MTWTKDGTFFGKENTIIFNNVTVKDVGQYGCTAENRAGKITATIWIEVLGKRRKAYVYRMSIQKLLESSNSF